MIEVIATHSYGGLTTMLWRYPESLAYSVTRHRGANIDQAPEIHHFENFNQAQIEYQFQVDATMVFHANQDRNERERLSTTTD